MYRRFESIQRAMRRDEPKTPEPMRSTLPNTDQPRIPPSEYHNTGLAGYYAGYCAGYYVLLVSTIGGLC